MQTEAWGRNMPGNVKPKVLSAKDLDVYKVTYKIAMEIFEISRFWQKEEKYSLTDQIRRSSRSVCANLRKLWLPARREKTAKQELGWISPQIADS